MLLIHNKNLQLWYQRLPRFKFILNFEDFGFAEEINEEELTTRVGTPSFIAPEVFRNQPYTILY